MPATGGVDFPAILWAAFDHAIAEVALIMFFRRGAAAVLHLKKLQGKRDERLINL